MLFKDIVSAANAIYFGIRFEDIYIGVLKRTEEELAI
jgi:hypothetical protein